MAFNFVAARDLGKKALHEFEGKMLSDPNELTRSIYKSEVELIKWMINLIEAYQHEGKISEQVDVLRRISIDSVPWDSHGFANAFSEFISHVEHEQKKSAFFGKPVDGF